MTSSESSWGRYELTHGDRDRDRGSAMREEARGVFRRLDMELEVERMKAEEAGWEALSGVRT